MEVVLVAVAAAEVELLALVGRRVVKVPGPVALARTSLGQQVAEL